MRKPILSCGKYLIISITVAALLPVTTVAQMEEIVVTAQKRSEDVQDVPISISTYSNDFLQDSSIDTLQDLGAYTPNLTLSQSSSVANQRIIMRGVGSVGNNAIEPSVAVFIDGVYYPRPSSVVGTLSDLEMIEVLRGPQGTLFGRNASMGALNIRTAKPSDEFEGNIRLSYGDFDEFRVSGSVSNSLSEQTSGRLSFHYSDRDGYGDNTFTSGSNGNGVGAWNDFGFRGKLNFTPSDVLDINITVDYAKVNNQGSVIEVKSDTVLPAYIARISGALTNPAIGIVPGPTPSTTDTFDYNINQDHRDDAEDEQWGAALDISWSMGEHTIRSITAFRDWGNNTFESALRLPADLLNRVTAYEAKTLSQELHILSPTGGFTEYIAGFYYYDEEYNIDQQFTLGPDFCPTIGNLVTGKTRTPAFGAAAAAQCAAGPQGTVAKVVGPFGTGAVDLQFRQDLTSIAGFGQVTFNIDDRFRVTGGLRWTDDDKTGSFTQLVSNSILLPPTPTNRLAVNLRTPVPQQPLTFSDSEITWLANISYDISGDVMGFATYSTGFKSGGFNSDGANRQNISRTFISETVDNFEFGIRSILFDSSLMANLTFFQTNISHFQDRQFDGINFIVQDDAELTQSGFEMDLRAQPNEHLYVIASVSYLDSDFDSFPNATAPLSVIANTAPGETPTPQDLTGQSNHFSPEWQASLVAEWRDTLPNSGLGWYIRGEYQFVDDQNVGAETNQNLQSIQAGYDLLNARVGVTGQAEKWELALFIKNATDTGYCQTIFNQPIGTTLGLVDPITQGGMQRCVLGTPRTFGVEAAYAF